MSNKEKEQVNKYVKDWTFTCLVQSPAGLHFQTEPFKDDDVKALLKAFKDSGADTETLQKAFDWCKAFNKQFVTGERTPGLVQYKDFELSNR